MKIAKIVRKTYEVKPFLEVWDISMGEFRRQRKEIGMSTKGFDKCFCCEHLFRDKEIPIIAHVYGIGNKFLCKECASKDNIVMEDEDIPKWIPVKSGKFPNPGQMVWITVKSADGKLSTCCRRFYGKVDDTSKSENTREYETLGIDTAFYGNRVIAWQPLDEEPYREE